MVRVWHRYEKWEDYKFGMWRDLSKDDSESLVKKASEFMSNTYLFKAAMRRVVYEWPISSEHNLSNINANRRSWIGQSACAIEIHCPEDITREAWGLIGKKLQNKANKAADSVISEWESIYENKNYQLHIYMGTQRLSGWNPRRSGRKTRGIGNSPFVSPYLQGHFEERCGS